MAIDTKALRGAFSSYMTGVTVVTAQASDGSLVGFTANSFTSVSLDPPLLLVCPGNHLNSYSVFEQCDYFAVNILSDEQEAISNDFAQSTGDRFAGIDWLADRHGCPLISGCSATFSCSVHSRQTMGDHLVLIGEIIGFEHSGLPGLGYCSNGYFTLGKERQANAAVAGGHTGITGIIIEHAGQVLLSDVDGKKSIPLMTIDEGNGARSSLLNHIEPLGLNVSIGPVYSIYDDAASGQRYTIFTGTASNDNTGQLGDYCDMDTLITAPFVENAQANMMKRFHSEFQTKEFGLYVGDTNHGEVYPE